MAATPQLTLQDVIDCISFEPGTARYDSLKGIVESAFNIEIMRGKTEHEAATIALNILGKQLDKLVK